MSHDHILERLFRRIGDQPENADIFRMIAELLNAHDQRLQKIEHHYQERVAQLTQENQRLRHAPPVTTPPPAAPRPALAAQPPTSASQVEWVQVNPGLRVPAQHFQSKEGLAAVRPEAGMPTRFPTSPRWQLIQRLYAQGSEEEAIRRFHPEKLSVPAHNQQARRNQQGTHVELTPHERGGEPHYYAYRLESNDALVPNLKHKYNKSFVQITGLDYFFDFKPTLQAAAPQIQSPALVQNTGGVWSLIQKGELLL